MGFLVAIYTLYFNKKKSLELKYDVMNDTYQSDLQNEDTVVDSEGVYEHQNHLIQRVKKNLAYVKVKNDRERHVLNDIQKMLSSILDKLNSIK
ncbi:MAG: hypothetical protein CR968_05415 [Flavobacteriia bacterium]|nr:MAG: hypothetical protein CR968_05415 [Flavobacteriia bacterium]